MKNINSILYKRKPRVNNIRLFFTSHSYEMMAQVLENNTTFDQETRGMETQIQGILSLDLSFLTNKAHWVVWQEKQGQVKVKNLGERNI